MSFVLSVALYFPALVQQQGKDTGVGYCALHRVSGRTCEPCDRASTRPSRVAGGGGGNDAQLVAGIMTSLLGELLRGDPQKAARLEAEARERAAAYERAAVEAARQKNETFARLFREMKLGPDFDGGGGLKLKGVGGEPESGGGPALKLGDGDLKPKGTSAAPNDRDTGDPMVVDLRNFQRAYYVASKPDATPDAIVAAAQGEVAVIVPTADAVPLSGDGLKRFQEANNAFRRSHHDGRKEAEYFNQVQTRREIVGRELREMKADLERQLALEKDTATLARKHELMAQIFKAARAEQEAWLSAKMELDARRAREAFDRTQLVKVVKELKPGAPPPPPPANETLEEKGLRTKKSINALAAKLGWTDAERMRLAKAMDEASDVPGKYMPEKIRSIWKDLELEAKERELAARAAVGEGPDVVGSGTQTDKQDCAVFALATAAGLPYQTVCDRAALLIRHGDWRTPEERVDASATVLTGLNGGEVLMLAESFGQVEVLPTTEFARTLREGRPVLVNLVPPSGNTELGHQVVLTRTYQIEGKTWFEMIDSNLGPKKRRHLSLDELDILIHERGIVYRSPEASVPMLLREDGAK